MAAAIRQELLHCKSFTFSVAFITSSALAMLKPALLGFQGRGTIITSRYLDFNDPVTFRELRLLKNVDVYIHDDLDAGFHAKGYVFEKVDGVTAIVGSSNLTDKALVENREWNLKFSALPDGDIALQLQRLLKQQAEKCIPLSEEWIHQYEAERQPPKFPDPTRDPLPPRGRILPNPMQSEALDNIEKIRAAGNRRALVISATGTGKTILAALAVRAAKPKRMLFIAHRQQILEKAQSEFQRVLGCKDNELGLFVGKYKELDRRYVFASIQSLNSAGVLESIDPEAFDYVIVDEVHRSGAKSYVKLIETLQPKFLLGLTATPERTDGFNVFELFDYNVAYEIRLTKALEARMLVPFHYYGVTDYSFSGTDSVDEHTDLSRLVAEERVKYVLQMLRTYGHADGVCGLMFCSRKEEAAKLSEILNGSELNGRKLRTATLSGDDSIEHRNRTVQRLEDGELDYILTVDIFNEGVDIPAVNQIVMLRPTQSAIIFIQQLGRGLRKAKNKDHLRVIDFIGNYKNNYLIPLALMGEQGRKTGRIKRGVVATKGDNSIAGLSSINFDQIAEERILKSIDSAPLHHLKEVKKEILAMQDRLNRVPKLIDFALRDSIDPVTLANTTGSLKNYWDVLYKIGLRPTPPNEAQANFLYFFSKELLPGKRPHELLLMQGLLDHGELSSVEFETLLARKSLSQNPQLLESSYRVLDFSFYAKPIFGDTPPVQRDRDMLRLNDLFITCMKDETFAQDIRDIVETGLLISEQSFNNADTLIYEERYSRREIARLLNYSKDKSETFFGYAADQETMTIPIFVTYRKDHRFSEETSYGDEFLSHDLLKWYTRSRRRISTPEVKRILSGDYRLLLFAQRSKDDKEEFYYLGDVFTQSARQEKQASGQGGVDIVQIDLSLEVPLSDEMFRYFTANGEMIDA